jgi:hypothetical protein
MAHIGYGYGSECHLLRWMGRHRNAFDKVILNSIGKTSTANYINWLDFGFSTEVKKWYDSELKGLDFIENPVVKSKWEFEWPVKGEQQNWDAVGLLTPLNDSHNESEIILIEAKAHTGEINTPPCKAVSPTSIAKISNTLKKTAEDLGVEFNEKVWMKSYYQLANRLAIYDFLKRNGYKPHLILLYFIGDLTSKNRNCPLEVSDWVDVISNQDKEMGIENIFKTENIYKLFLHVVDGKYGWSSQSDPIALKFEVKDMVIL